MGYGYDAPPTNLDNRHAQSQKAAFAFFVCGAFAYAQYQGGLTDAYG